MFDGHDAYRKGIKRLIRMKEYNFEERKFGKQKKNIVRKHKVGKHFNFKLFKPVHHFHKLKNLRSHTPDKYQAKQKAAS